MKSPQSPRVCFKVPRALLYYRALRVLLITHLWLVSAQLGSRQLLEGVGALRGEQLAG